MAEPFLINGEGGGMDKLGVFVAEQTWEVDSLAECISHTPDHPLQIPLLERQWRMQPHGKYWLTLKFEGVNDISAADGNEDYEGDSGMAEDPIESHWDIESLVLNFSATEKDGRYIFPQKITEEGTGKEVQNPMYGVEAYRLSNPIWTQHKLHAELPQDLYQGLDAVIKGSPPAPNGQEVPTPPPIPGSEDKPARNWRLERVIPRLRGNIWQVSTSWALSGPGGWNPYVYRYG